MDFSNPHPRAVLPLLSSAPYWVLELALVLDFSLCPQLTPLALALEMTWKVGPSCAESIETTTRHPRRCSFSLKRKRDGVGEGCLFWRKLLAISTASAGLQMSPAGWLLPKCLYVFSCLLVSLSHCLTPLFPSLDYDFLKGSVNPQASSSI